MNTFAEIPGCQHAEVILSITRQDRVAAQNLASNLSLRIAEAEFAKHQPDVVVGSSRGGAVAINMNSGDTPLVLLCPAWKNWGDATTVKPNTVILHSRADDVIPFADSEEIASNSKLPNEALIEIGNDGFEPPLDEIDGAARVCDPIFLGENEGDHPFGKFFKDYRSIAW